jgi:hypothetical protein
MAIVAIERFVDRCQLAVLDGHDGRSIEAVRRLADSTREFANDIRPPTSQRTLAPLPSGGWKDAEIILNNNSPNDAIVKPTVYRAGASGKSVALPPSEVRWVRLSEINGPARRDLTTNDGLELSSQGRMLESSVVKRVPSHHTTFNTAVSTDTAGGCSWECGRRPQLILG